MEDLSPESESANSMRTRLVKRSGFEKKKSDIVKKPYPKKKRSKLPNKEEELVEEEEIAPSVFPEVLGYNPYLPPAMAESKRTRQRVDSRQRNRSVTTPTPTALPPINYGDRKFKDDSSPPKPTPIEDKVIPKLAYDLDTGRVYDENTDSWFKLVPV